MASYDYKNSMLLQWNVLWNKKKKEEILSLENKDTYKYLLHLL